MVQPLKNLERACEGLAHGKGYLLDITNPRLLTVEHIETIMSIHKTGRTSDIVKSIFNFRKNFYIQI